jgi:EF-P beta-lysylation protein EpmB
VRSIGELLDLLELQRSEVPDGDFNSMFPLLVPREFVARMQKRDPLDPLLLQVLPLHQEHSTTLGDSLDPVGDLASQKAAGLLHKYPGRVLLIASGACAVHCRYCFRRHFPYMEQPKSLEHWQPAIRAIADDSSIEEVILSGGDPLSLGNAKLRRLIQAIEAIPHVRRLRLHTRFPVMIPSRIDAGLIALFRRSRLATYLVWHINHSREIDDAVSHGASALKRAGVTLLNQAVLLHRINDSTEAQCDLAARLLDAGIIPYYLHQLDRVQGAAHFDCPSEMGETIVIAMRERLPGYAVPRLVKEIRGEMSKTLIR